MPGSQVDYDGDGDTNGRIYYEIEGVREYLYAAIQPTPPTWRARHRVRPDAYPYFFADANANGAVDEEEEGFAS